MIDTSGLPPHMLPPDPNTEEGRKKIEAIRRHNEGIGKLITIFPGIEVSLFAMLGNLWPVPLPVAKAIYGDLRIDAAMGTAKRLLEARKQMMPTPIPAETEIAKWLNYVFDQLGIINGIRNHIVHHGIMGTADFANPVSSNRLRARGEAQVKEIAVSAEEVEAMNYDLSVIVSMLAVIGTAMRSPPVPQAEGFKLLEQTSRQFPWRYKSPLQGGRTGRSQTKTQGQQPPPQSSPAK